MLPLSRPRPIRATRMRRARRPETIRLTQPERVRRSDPLPARSAGIAFAPAFQPEPAGAPATSPALAPAVGPAVASRDGGALRIVLVVAPIAAIAVGIVAMALSLVASPIQVIVAVVLPLAILCALALGDRPGPRVLAAIALDLEALLSGAVSPAGMAFALVLPLIAIGLVQPLLRGRALLAAFALSAVTAVVGVALAVGVGPARALLPDGSAFLTVVSFAAVTAFALALDWRATQHLTATLAAAEVEIAERLAAETRQRETSEILSAILTSSPVATQAFDRDRRVLVWNPASERTFGWTADEVVGQPLPEAMVPTEDLASSRARIQRTMAGSTTNGERVRRLTKDGDERWVDIYAAPLIGRDGTAIGIAGQMVDVTDRVRMEAQLAQAQKMGAVGLLASGIAHDFNNTLTAAGGYAELIRDSVEGPARDDASALIEVVDRGRQLTRQLLDFARRGDGTAAMVDLRDVVVGIEPLIRRLIGGTIAVEIALAGEPLMARIQVGQLEQSLINLAINARDAMPAGGRLRIVVDVAAAHDRKPVGDATAAVVAVPRHGPARSDDIVVIVADSGVGIPPSILASVFEPFFTTKPVGVGTGLGLAMVRGFVEGAAGSLVVATEIGAGTTLTIRLPRARPTPTA